MAVLAALKGGHTQPHAGLGLQVSLLTEEARHLLFHSIGVFHLKNLCCLFIIARSIIPGELEKRAE